MYYIISAILQGTSVCQVTLIGIMVILLYTSRACYNLVVLALTDIENINSFDYDWYNVSDQVTITPVSSLSWSLFLHIHNRLSTYLHKNTLFFPFWDWNTLTNTTSCDPAGRPEVQSGWCWICGIRGDSVHLGTSAHLPGGLLLQGSQASTRQGEVDMYLLTCLVFEAIIKGRLWAPVISLSKWHV